MGLDRDAIEKVEELAKSSQFWNENSLEDAIAIIGGERVDLEKYQPNRRNYRVKYTTTELADFVGYVDKHAAVPVYVDPDSMKASTIFDLGDESAPGHALHTASLALRRTPELDAILATEPKYLSQQDAVLFLQDWSHCFVVAGHGEEQMLFSAVLAAIRRIKIESSGSSESAVGNMAASRSALENVGVANVLPEYIVLKYSPYVGLPEMEYTLHVLVNLEGQKPSIRFRLMQRGSLQDRIAKSFVDELRGRFIDRDVRIGTLTA
jgi:uncharacterized protein YfdQ (DUF2303 family)